MSSQELTCQYCEKSMKSKSGKSLHEKKCKILHEIKQEKAENATPSVEESNDTQEQVPASEPKEKPVVLSGPVGEELPEGTVIQITGQVWYQKPGADAWESANAYEVDARVQCVMSNEQGKFVIAKTVAGSAIWAVGLNTGLFKVVKYPTNEKVGQLVDGTKFNMNTGEVVRSASVEEQDGFKEAIRELQHAKKKKLEAEKELKNVEKKYKFKIEEFTKKHGIESRDGKMDAAVFCGNTLIHLVRTPGKIVTTIKDNVVVDWALKNDMQNILKTSVDTKKYEDVKKLGMIPADKIQEFEVQKEIDEKFALTIKDTSANCKNCGHEFSGETGVVYDADVQMDCPNCGDTGLFSKSLFK